MDPISRKSNVTPPATGGIGDVSAAKGSKVFSMDAQQGVPKTVSASVTGSSPLLESMRKTIAESSAVAPGDRSKAMDSVVGKLLDAKFGQTATPQMRQFVTESIQNDPHFNAVFNRLFSEVSSSTKS